MAAARLIDALGVGVTAPVVAVGAFVRVLTGLAVAGEALVTDAFVIARAVDTGGVITALQVAVGTLVDVCILCIPSIGAHSMHKCF